MNAYKDYIDETIGFYFDGGFHQMIIDSELDEEEIEEWASIAYLFSFTIKDYNFIKKQMYEVLELLIDFYTVSQVDYMTENKVDRSIIKEIMATHDSTTTDYAVIMDRAIRLINANGVSLYKLISNK